MFILYIQTGCPYCSATIQALDMLGLPFESRNIESEVYRDELLARGGKIQVPYFVDTSRSVEMYESEDIAKYVQTHYRNNDDSPWSIASE